MKTPRRTKQAEAMRQMFETKSHAWREVGLAREISVQAARRARRQLFLLLPLLTGILVAYRYRHDLFHTDTPVRLATVVALVLLGWAFARDLGRAVGPALFLRLDPATAGTVGFLLRLMTMGVVSLAALNIAGLPPRTLAVGGAFTAVVFGLAAQQTLGNVIAGVVLLSARPFRVGERVRLRGGGIETEGVVASLGLLYTTLATGDDKVMVPNSVLLSLAISPLREPDGVDVRARLPLDARPTALQELLTDRVTVPTRQPPDIALEEVDGGELVVRISATPVLAADGATLADEILDAVAQLSGHAEIDPGSLRERAGNGGAGAGAGEPDGTSVGAEARPSE
jgi:small-conductance mechanosensitive channel